MKQILILLLLTFSGVVFSNPNNAKNIKEFEQITKKMCAKTDECVKIAFANLPPAQRKTAANFSQVKTCMAAYDKYGRNPAPGKGKDRTITKEDIEELKKCSSDFTNTSCDDLADGKDPESCLKFK